MIELVGRIKRMVIENKRQMTAAPRANKAFNFQVNESTYVDKDDQCVVNVK